MATIHRRRESGAGSWSLGWSLDWSLAGSLAIAALISIGPAAAQEQALLVRDSNPWGYSAWQSELTAAGIPYATIDSATLATTDLSDYAMVITVSVQSNAYYNNLATAAPDLEDYVDGGGVLVWSGCTQGPQPAPPLGGTNVYGTDSYNTVIDATHPLVAGVTNPMYGNSASHNSFTGLPADAEVLLTRQANSNPTLYVLEFGMGLLIGSGLTWEYGWGNGQDAGTVLVNTIDWGWAYEPCAGVDADGDGWTDCDLDCDNGDPTVHPGAQEICNDGRDSDCGYDLAATEIDNDGDGFTECGGDCDDDESAISPARPEICDGLDNDCNPATSETDDGDADGFTICEGDCDDHNPASRLDGTEVCDGADDDCDGVSDAYDTDCAAGDDDDSADDPGGCSCGEIAATGGGLPSAAWLLALAGVALVRRRRPRGWVREMMPPLHAQLVAAVFAGAAAVVTAAPQVARGAGSVDPAEMRELFEACTAAGVVAGPIGFAGGSEVGLAVNLASLDPDGSVEIALDRLPSLAGFAARPSVTLGAFEAGLLPHPGEVPITLEFGVEGGRPLTIAGTFRAADVPGELCPATFWIRDPLLPDADTLSRYAADPALDSGSAVFVLDLADGRPSTLRFGGSSAETVTLARGDGQVLALSSSSSSTTTRYVDGQLSWERAYTLVFAGDNGAELLVELGFGAASHTDADDPLDKLRWRRGDRAVTSLLAAYPRTTLTCRSGPRQPVTMSPDSFTRLEPADYQPCTVESASFSFERR